MMLLGVIQVVADNVTLYASGPSIVEVGERFRVQYSVSSQNVSDFSYPPFTGFDVIYGPSTSSQSSIQIINGQMSQSSSYTYTFTLMAQKTGTFTIPSASIQVGGKTYKSKSIKIQVVASSSGHQRAQSQQGQYPSQQRNQGTSQRQSTAISGSDLFMTANASRTRVYEQEAILVTYKLYTLVNLTQLDGKLPTLDGFQIQEIPLPNNKEFTTESYNGKIYHAVVWSQYVLFPQKSGNLVIPPITYEGVVVQQNRSVDPIEAFFNGNAGMVEVKKKITTPKLTIHVSPLPTKPAGFSGAVGLFNISSSISSDKVKTNDALTLKIKLNGTGNMKLISVPEVAFPKDFETYDAKVNDRLSLTRSGLSGSKEFEYLAVPRHAGKFTIPATKFVYFDTSKHAYKTIVTEPYIIRVEKGSGSQSSVSNYTNNQQDIKELNQDIRYINIDEAHPIHKGENFFGSWKYWISYFIPLIAFLVILVVGHKRIQDNANVAKSRGRKANKIAMKRLKVAAKLLAAKNQNEFYDEVMRTLWGYIADKLNIPLAVLNKDSINVQLNQKQVGQELIDEFIKTLNECEFARYAPGNTNENMEAVYNSAVNVISRMEDNIKKVSIVRTDHTILMIGLMLLGMFTITSANAQTKQQADKLYAKDNYQAAAKIYESIIQKQGAAPELYYNLGNCYYKLDEIAKSVLNYERALLLDPDNSNAKANLVLARDKTIDKITPASELFFIAWWKNLTNIMGINSWLVIAYITFILMLTGILAYAFLSNIIFRKIGAYGAIACLIITLIANLSALSQYIIMTNKNYAIIMAPAITVKSSPSDSSTDLFIIHEGSKVEILDDTMAKWHEIKLEEGKVGWIPVEALEQI